MKHFQSLQELARALGGDVQRNAVLVPGPNHSPRDRSLSIRLSVGSPDGFLCHSHAGDDWRLCRDYVRERLGLADDTWRDRSPTLRFNPSPNNSDVSARTARAIAIWDEARHPRGTLVERYLTNRGLKLDDDAAGAAIRFHPRCPWRDKETGTTLYVSCMIAGMRRIDNDQLTAVQRTRLTEDGQKVDRRMLGIAASAAVKMDADERVTHGLIIGEGAETVLAGRMLGFCPAWALGSAGAVASFPVLSGIACLTVLIENDASGTNQRASDECAERWHAAGREVFLIEPRSGNDVADAIRGCAA